MGNNTMYTNHFTHTGPYGTMYNNAFTQQNQGRIGPCGTVYNNAFSANIAWHNELHQQQIRHDREMIQQRERMREEERQRENARRIAESHAALLRSGEKLKREVETQRKQREEGLHLKLRCAWDASTTCIVVRHDEQVASSIREKLFLPSNRGFSLCFEEGKDRMSLSRIAENKTTFQELSLEQHATITVLGTPKAQTKQKRAKQRAEEQQAVDPFAPLDPVKPQPVSFERTKSEQEFDAYFGAETIVWEPCFPPASTHAAPAC